MSYSALMRVYPGKKKQSEEIAEYRNGWGTAPIVWVELSKRYGVADPLSFMGDRGEAFWELAYREDVPLHHRMVIAFTFDRVYVSKADFKALADAIDKWQAEAAEFLKDKVNHWPAISAELKKARCTAIGLYPTSVGENLWTVRGKDWADYGDLMTIIQGAIG